MTEIEQAAAFLADETRRTTAHGWAWLLPLLFTLAGFALAALMIH